MPSLQLPSAAAPNMNTTQFLTSHKNLHQKRQRNARKRKYLTELPPLRSPKKRPTTKIAFTSANSPASRQVHLSNGNNYLLQQQQQQDSLRHRSVPSRRRRHKVTKTHHISKAGGRIDKLSGNQHNGLGGDLEPDNRDFLPEETTESLKPKVPAFDMSRSTGREVHHAWMASNPIRKSHLSYNVTYPEDKVSTVNFARMSSRDQNKSFAYGEKQLTDLFYSPNYSMLNSKSQSAYIVFGETNRGQSGAKGKCVITDILNERIHKDLKKLKKLDRQIYSMEEPQWASEVHFQ